MLRQAVPFFFAFFPTGFIFWSIEIDIEQFRRIKLPFFTIDTLSTAENLKASGFSESQAIAITETVLEAQTRNLGVLLQSWTSNNI